MRDINRIDPFLKEFGELWKQYPDLRFGQIMSNMARHMQMDYRKDMFFMEDDELMAAMKKAFFGVKKNETN